MGPRDTVEFGGRSVTVCFSVIMAVPVFVSLPTRLHKEQEKIRDALYGRIADYNLEPRTVGSPYDVALKNPLHEVRTLASHCSGGLVLGFVQTYVAGGKLMKWADSDGNLVKPPFPTPWNHLETGILFGLDLPVLVFREDGIVGGIFDPESSDLFLHPMPTRAVIRPPADLESLLAEEELRQLKDGRQKLTTTLSRWSARVHQHYYRD